MTRGFSVAKNILIDKKLQIDSLYEEGYKLQQRIAELEEAQRWIPVGERLPKYDPSKGANAYWIAKKTRNGEWQMKIALYSDYGYATTVDIPENVTWRDYDFCQIMNVTHWRPLPQPPQKGE